jgi:hypothetical protein
MKHFPILNNIEESKHFCVLPWIHFHAWPDKRVLPCCVANSEMSVSTTDRGDVLDIMNSDRYKQIRLDMLDDKPIEECKRCYALEDYGIWSMRKSNNRRRYQSSEDLVKGTGEDGSISDFKLKYLDIRFSNLCNFKCRTCGPACSSRWAEEYVQMYKGEGKKNLKTFFNMEKIVVSNNEQDSLLKKITPYLLDVEEVYFAGGEALITEEHYDILDYWIKHNHTDVELTYTTNFSITQYKDKNVLEYWKLFKNVQIWASLDAQGELIEFMRHGADWGQIHDNILNLKQQLPHVKFGITPTISIYNIFDFPKFHWWLLENNLIDLDGMRLNILTYPWYMGIDILPEFAARQAQQIWRIHHHNMKEKYPTATEYTDQLLPIIGALDNPKSNRGGVQEFFKLNDTYDKLRNENLFSTVPQLKELYEWAMKEDY